MVFLIIIGIIILFFIIIFFIGAKIQKQEEKQLNELKARAEAGDADAIKELQKLEEKKKKQEEENKKKEEIKQKQKKEQEKLKQKRQIPGVNAYGSFFMLGKGVDGSLLTSINIIKEVISRNGGPKDFIEKISKDEPFGTGVLMERVYETPIGDKINISFSWSKYGDYIELNDPVNRKKSGETNRLFFELYLKMPREIVKKMADQSKNEIMEFLQRNNVVFVKSK